MPDVSRLTQRVEGRDAEDAVPQGDPVMVALEARDATGGGMPPVDAAGDVVRGTASLNGVPWAALIDPTGEFAVTVAPENAAAPAAPNAVVVGGRATTGLVALTTGDLAVLNFDLSGRLRVAQGAPAAGKTSVHVSFTQASIGAGASNETFRTVPAATHSRLLSVVAAYTGTVSGVTLQLRVGGELVDLSVGNLVSGVFYRLLPPGMEITADAAETFQVAIAGGTATDQLDVRAHFAEEAV